MRHAQIPHFRPWRFPVAEGHFHDFHSINPLLLANAVRPFPTADTAPLFPILRLIPLQGNETHKNAHGRNKSPNFTNSSVELRQAL